MFSEVVNLPCEIKYTESFSLFVRSAITVPPLCSVTELKINAFLEEERDEEADRRSATANARADDLFGVSQDFADQRLGDQKKDKSKEDEENNEFYNYKMPWSLRLSYAANYNNNRRQDEITSHSLMFSGDVELSPRWSIGASSGYDFLNQGFTFTQLRFERDLLSWRMNFTWVPFSNRSSWNFFIGIKSNLLKDLKYDQRRQPDRQLGN